MVQHVGSSGGGLPLRQRGDANFVGIDLGREAAPDKTMICKCRHLFEDKEPGKMMLTAVNDHLKVKGIKVGTGMIMDATLISSPSSTKNEKGERDL